MIVYNVKRRWFEMKNDAEAYRRAEGLPPAATHKLEIVDRTQLSALLNALCGIRQSLPEPIDYSDELAQAEIADNLPEDWMPAFLLKDYRS